MHCAACTVFCLAALGEQLPIRTYTSADGLAANTIDRIVRDSRGYLWFCTREGISRFDGYEFQNFGVVQGLPALDSDLVETPAGDYWIATGDGVARFRPGNPNPHFTIFRPSDPLAHRMQALAIDPAGGIWAGGTGGLYHLDPPHPPAASEWQLRLVNIGLLKQNVEDVSVRALLVDRAGSLWVGTESGFYRRFPDGRSEATAGGSPHPDVTTLLEDRQGRLWAGTRHGVCSFPPDHSLAGRRAQDVCVTVPGLGGGVIYFLHETTDGMLWAGSNGLLSAWRPGTAGVAQYTARNGLPGFGTQMMAAAEDLAGNLWVGGFGAMPNRQRRVSHLLGAGRVGSRFCRLDFRRSRRRALRGQPRLPRPDGQSVRRRKIPRGQARRSRRDGLGMGRGPIGRPGARRRMVDPDGDGSVSLSACLRFRAAEKDAADGRL